MLYKYERRINNHSDKTMSINKKDIMDIVALIANDDNVNAVEAVNKLVEKLDIDKSLYPACGAPMEVVADYRAFIKASGSEIKTDCGLSRVRHFIGELANSLGL